MIKKTTKAGLDFVQFHQYLCSRCFKQIIFTDKPVPQGVLTTDFSDNGSNEIVGWEELIDNVSTWFISSQKRGIKIKAPKRISYMFGTFRLEPEGGVLNFTHSNDWLGLIELIDVSNLDVSQVEDFDGVFAYCGFKSKRFDIRGLETWKTSNANSMVNMFMFTGENSEEVTFDVSYFNTKKVEDFSNMFYGCGKKATNWHIGFLDGWDVSNSITMYGMFNMAGENAKCWSIGDISSWDVSNVTTMRNMFSEAGKNAETWYVGNISKWNTESVSDMSGMFNETGQEANFKLDLSKWKVGNVQSFFNFAVSCFFKIQQPIWPAEA